MPTVYIHSLSGNTLCFSSNDDFGVIRAYDIKEFIYNIEGIPTNEQTIKCNGKYMCNNSILPNNSTFPTIIDVQSPIKGGKGGFGSLLRGGQPGAQKKKITNNDACRDLSGRRIRHVKQEQELAKWTEEQKKKRKKI